MFALMLLGALAAHAALEMIPEDGSCLPGDTIQLFAPEPDTGEPWTCAWSADEILGEPPEGAFGEIACPDCGRHIQDQVYALYVVCTDADGDAQWDFDDITVRCSEVELAEEATPEGCACGAGGAMSLAWVLVLPVVLGRRRGAGSP